MKAEIAKIIRAGTMAPSGDNCQPWRFLVTGDSIDIFLLPERDTSLYSWGHRASYIAHGALLENIAVQAQSLGFDARIDELPDPANQLHTAHVALTKSAPKHHPLTHAIFQRSTNRKKYSSEPLSTAARKQLAAAGGDSVRIIEDAPQRLMLARAIAANEKVLFEDRHMHRFFFDHMLWTPQHISQHPIGFPVSALELPPPIEAIWPAFRHWPVMSVFSAIGFANIIALGNAPIYASGAETLCFTIKDRSISEFMRAGHALQRVWLTATSLGLQGQILTGIPLLMNQIAANESKLSKTHEQIVQTNYESITRVANSPFVAFLLRLGLGHAPSARTPREAII